MIHVLTVKYAGGLSLAVEFDDETHGTADLGPLIASSPLYAPLADLALFRRVYVDDGSVCWPDELDLTAARIYALVHSLPLPDTLEQADRNELTMRSRDPRYLSPPRARP